MIKDVRSYINSVGSRLTKAFQVDVFEQETEVEFWARAADMLSQEQPPEFRQMVQWVDLLFRSPVHFVYRRDGDKMRLFRRQPLPGNIGGGTTEPEQQAERKAGTPKAPHIRAFEEELENLQPTIRYREEFKFVDQIALSVGKCRLIPLYVDSELWGVYGVGPDAVIPEQLLSRLSVVSRILGSWMEQRYRLQEESQLRFSRRVKEQIVHTSDLDIRFENISHYLMSFLLKQYGASAALFADEGAETRILQSVRLDHPLLHAFEDTYAEGTPDLGTFYRQHRPLFEEYGIRSMKRVQLAAAAENLQLYLFFGGEKRSELLQDEMSAEVRQTLTALLQREEENRRFVNRLLETYHHMIRTLERSKNRLPHHTARVEGFCRRFALLFGLSEEETEMLLKVARLHDIGYLSIENRSIGSEVEHPVLGRMMLEGLGLSAEITEGVAAHHEWVNGSGTPRGLKEEQIPWTAKIVAIFEYIVQFIEQHSENSERSGDELLMGLTEAVRDRAGQQFDMLLVPTVTELIQSLGWQGCCGVGVDA